MDYTRTEKSSESNYYFYISVSYQCFVIQMEGQVYYPQEDMQYHNLSSDEKIINFCIYCKFKFESNVIFMSGDLNCLARANNSNIDTWNPDKDKNISNHINEYGKI